MKVIDGKKENINIFDQKIQNQNEDIVYIHNIWHKKYHMEIWSNINKVYIII